MKQVLLFFLLAILSSCVKILPQDAAPVSSLSNTEAQYRKFAAENGYDHVSNDTNIRLISALPVKLGDWSEERERYVINYEVREHGLGYSKRYNEGPSRSIWADVYLFHARQTGMSDGIASEQFANVWEQSISGSSFIRTCNVKDKTDTVQTINGIKFRKCRLAMTSGRKQFEGLMFITVFDGTFLKARISYAPDYKNAEMEIDKFMNDLTSSLNKQKI